MLIKTNTRPIGTAIAIAMAMGIRQKRFPADNFAEWNNGHPLGLRTVHAYVLVYDMGNLETFQVRPTPPCNSNDTPDDSHLLPFHSSTAAR